MFGFSLGCLQLQLIECAFEYLQCPVLVVLEHERHPQQVVGLGGPPVLLAHLVESGDQRLTRHILPVNLMQSDLEIVT